MFSFGDPVPDPSSGSTGLSFYNLVINMDFSLITNPVGQPKYSVQNRQFKFDAGNMAFDLSQTSVHSGSLYNHFPLTVTGIITGTPGQKPADYGYIEAEIPDGVSFQGLQDYWYGLVCTLNLGSVGALASLAGFNANIILAWSPSASQVNAVIGLKLPGTGSKQSFSFESVLSLALSGLKFMVEYDDQQRLYYGLRLRSIALSFLGINIPSGGNTSVILFGNPASPGQIAWYGAYYEPTT